MEQTENTSNTVITVHPIPPSREPSASSDELRHEFAAESLSDASRIGVALASVASLTMAGGLLSAALVWSDGAIHFGWVGTVFFASWLGLTWLLVFVHAALLQNNCVVSKRARLVWLVAFALTGPVAFLAYWQMHVWPARHVPRKDD